MTSKKTTITIPGKRPLWRDPRFLLGVALIAVSTIACTLLISQAKAGVNLYQTTRDIAEGEQIGPANTRIVTVRPGSDSYIVEGGLHDGAIAKRSIGADELLARSAVADSDDGAKRRLVVTVADGLPASVRPGDTLELWALPSTNAGVDSQQETQVVADQVTLVSVLDDSTNLAHPGTRIEIRFMASELPAILKATSQGARLAAVPVGTI